LDGIDDILRLVAVLALLAGFAVAAYLDWTTREVTDLLWQLLSVAGAVIGAILLLPDGAMAVGLWIVLCAFVFEHLLPWDVPVERLSESLPTVIEILAYIVVSVLFVFVALVDGVGPSGLPVEVLAAFVTVLFARGLFEAGLLYGGADAKAMIAAAILLPILSSAVISLPSGTGAVLSVYPFALTMLMNAALVAVVIPIAIAFWNLRRGEFNFARGFTGYTIPVAELPNRFVWLKDPTFRRPTEEFPEAETSEDDRKIRDRQRTELEAQGIARVWVTPQVPFLVLFFAGALLAVLAGNLLVDLFVLL
jgi:preflagellin peptidase FlaK